MKMKLLGGLRGRREEAPEQEILTSEAVDSKSGFDFSGFGERGEELSERVSAISAKFESLQALRQEFEAMIAPVGEMVLSHSKAQTRLAEQDALLAQHLETTTSLRQALTDLQANSVSAESELAGLRHQVSVMRSQALADEDALNQMKREVADAEARASLLERQLAAQVDEHLVLTNSTAALERELDDLRRSASGRLAEIVELQQSLGMASSEVDRLQSVVHQLQPDLARSRQHILELEGSLHAAELALQNSEAKFLHESRERELLSRKHAQDKSDFEASLAAMTLQIDSLNGRHATTMKHLEQSRLASAEKSEAAQQWERSSREAVAARQQAERRAALAEEQTRNLTEQNRAAERMLTESKARSEMLSKALAAKDLQTTQLESKIANLESRYAVLSQDLEREQLESQSAKRRFIEELEREKAERALAQGALSIARASREKMAMQIEAAKRVTPSAIDSHHQASAAVKAAAEEETNVRFIRASDAQAPS
jgi:crescentin